MFTTGAIPQTGGPQGTGAGAGGGISGRCLPVESNGKHGEGKMPEFNVIIRGALAEIVMVAADKLKLPIDAFVQAAVMQSAQGLIMDSDNMNKRPIKAVSAEELSKSGITKAADELAAKAGDALETITAAYAKGRDIGAGAHWGRRSWLNTRPYRL